MACCLYILLHWRDLSTTTSPFPSHCIQYSDRYCTRVSLGKCSESLISACDKKCSCLGVAVCLVNTLHRVLDCCTLQKPKRLSLESSATLLFFICIGPRTCSVQKEGKFARVHFLKAYGGGRGVDLVTADPIPRLR